MGLTVRRISVKKLAVRRKKLNNFNRLNCRKKLTLKVFSFYNVLFFGYSGLTAAEKWPQF